jgi:hypothetical protein
LVTLVPVLEQVFETPPGPPGRSLSGRRRSAERRTRAEAHLRCSLVPVVRRATLEPQPPPLEHRSTPPEGGPPESPIARPSAAGHPARPRLTPTRPRELTPTAGPAGDAGSVARSSEERERSRRDENRAAVGEDPGHVSLRRGTPKRHAMKLSGSRVRSLCRLGLLEDSGRIRRTFGPGTVGVPPTRRPVSCFQTGLCPALVCSRPKSGAHRCRQGHATAWERGSSSGPFSP